MASALVPIPIPPHLSSFVHVSKQPSPDPSIHRPINRLILACAQSHSVATMSRRQQGSARGIGYGCLPGIGRICRTCGHLRKGSRELQTSELAKQGCLVPFKPQCQWTSDGYHGYCGSGGWTGVTFLHDFTQTPAVLVQIQTLGGGWKHELIN